MKTIGTLLKEALGLYARIYVTVDIHGTILEPSWDKTIEEYIFYPLAKKCLQELSEDPRITLILWSSSYPDRLEEYQRKFYVEGINFRWINSNPLEKDGDFACFSSGKFYSDIIIDDKAGFDPLTDWQELLDSYVEYST